MCDCYDRVKKNLTEHFQQKLPEGAQDFELELQGYLFGFGGPGVTHRSRNSVVVRYRAPKKAGGLKNVSQKTFIRASFCPFCGKSYEETDQCGS